MTLVASLDTAFNSKEFLDWIVHEVSTTQFVFQVASGLEDSTAASFLSFFGAAAVQICWGFIQDLVVCVGLVNAPLQLLLLLQQVDFQKSIYSW